MSLFSLMATLSLDTSGYDKGIEDSKSKISSLGGAVKQGVSALTKIGLAGIGVAATAVGTLAKKSVDGYAEYQQMVGGVQKLYGNMGMSLDDYAKSMGKSTDQVKSQWKSLESAQNLVLKNAQNAYKETGMSANQYMSMATSFSASLINSLGGDTNKAAEQTHVAMKAISDNFNTFGGDMGMIQGAFQGFAKQNYTMLDNLKLGYGGTKQEMERLVDDANKWAEANGKAAGLSVDSFSDVVTAIDYIQQKQNIAGTTAREASSTIEGSLITVKAAWENLVTGFSDPNADIGTLVQDLMTSAGSAISNLIPTFQQALTGIVSAIDMAIPTLVEKIPGLIDSMVVPLLGAGGKLLSTLGQSIVKNIPVLLSSMSDALSKLTGVFEQFSTVLLPAGVKMVSKLGDGIKNGIPLLINQVVPMILKLVQFIGQSAGPLLSTGVNLVVKLAQGLLNGIPVLISYIPQVVSTIWNALTSVDWVGLGKTLLDGITNGIKNATPKIISAIKGVAKSASNAFKNINWGEAGKKAIMLLGSALKSAGKLILTTLKSIGKIGITAFKSVNWKGVGKAVISFIGGAIRGAGKLVMSALKSAGQSAWNAFKNLSWVKLGGDIVRGIISGIGGAAGSLFNKLKGLASDALGAAKKVLKIGSPSKLFRDEVGKQIPAGMAIGVDRASYLVKRSMNNLNDLVTSYMPQFDFGVSQPSDPLALSRPDDYPYTSMDVLETPDERAPKNVTINNYITVDGSENPQEWTEEFVRTLKLEMRTA